MYSPLNEDLSLDDISGMQAIYAENNPLLPTLLGAGQELFQLLPNGLIYQRMVHPNNGWTIIDDNWKNHQIITKNGLLYLHHNQDGRIYQFGGAWKVFCLVHVVQFGQVVQLLDVDDPLGWKLPAGETNWQVLDEDPKNAAIACAGEFLFFWRNDRRLWEYLGETHPQTSYAGPVVRKVDDNMWNLSVGLDWPAGNGRRVVVVKSWGRIGERLT
ncbi:hypothetical protein QBC37DRAFT_406556 [Rhypophila decipiens]|uniref:Uncharacterized protein n=1 Tax=Rhypophila decipiens TaxID=261697 RepID=A0AAN6Y0G8_9PEZI|nr:hypothetical protein QBC37DRAFT_406556 [Rhypophila decipiens]